MKTRLSYLLNPFLLATALTNEISSFLYINQLGSISTPFWRYPLKSVRRKALGWISFFTRFLISRFLRRRVTRKNLNSIPGSREKNGKNNIMCKWQYKQYQTGNNACKLCIHFFNSFTENWGHWLIGHSAADEFRWQTSPQRRKHVPPQLRLAECSVMIFLLSYACYNYNTHGVGSTSKIWLLNRFQSVVPH